MEVLMKNDKKMHPHMKNEEGHVKHEAGHEASKKRVVAHHAEWELEKQTEGLTPSVEKASQKLGHELEHGAKKKASK